MVASGSPNARSAEVCFRRTVEAPDLANGLPLIATKQSLALTPPDGKVCPEAAVRIGVRNCLSWVENAPCFLPSRVAPLRRLRPLDSTAKPQPAPKYDAFARTRGT